MPRSPPPLDPEHNPVHRFARALREVHRRGGKPSRDWLWRQINVSHATGFHILNGDRFPSWQHAGSLVKACGGDPESLRNLWLQVDTVLETATPEPTLAQEGANKAAEIPDIHVSNDLQNKCTNYSVRQVEVPQSPTQVAIDEQAKERSVSPGSNSICTVAAIKIINLDAIREVIGPAIWQPKLSQLYGTASTIAAMVDPNTVVNLFDNMIVLVFDIDRSTDAINAVIQILEAFTDLDSGSLAEPHCSIGVSSGEVVKFAAYNTNTQYFGPVIDRAFGLCGAANTKAIFIDQTTAVAASMVRIRSQVGRALGRSPDQYQGDEQRILLKGFNEPIEYYEIFWDRQLYGVKSAIVTRDWKAS